MLLQLTHDVGTARTGTALHHNFLRRVQFVQAVHHLPLGNQVRPQMAQVGDVPLVRLAHVQNVQIVARIQPRLELRRG